MNRIGALLLIVALAFAGMARADEAPAPAPPPPPVATPDNMAAPPPSDAATPSLPPPPPAEAASPGPAPASDAPPPDASKEAPKAQTPDNAVKPPKNLEPIPKDSAFTVLGKKVLGPAGEDMGRVTDLLLDRDAHIKSIVIDFGGFLGVGSRKIAIDWRLARFVPDNPDAPIALGLGKAEVQAAPEYKDSAQPPVMVGPPQSGPDAAR